MPKTKELHFEEAIERHLLTSGGRAKGDPKTFDRKLGLVRPDLFAFIEATQDEAWQELRQHHRANQDQSVV